MGIADMQREYWVPECIREYLGALGFVLPLEAMEGLATARGPDCASGDSARARLCIRRQRAGQTVHLATACKPDCASGDSAQAKLCI